MRPLLITFVLAASTRAHADTTPTRPATMSEADRELYAYIAEAEAVAQAAPETVIVDDTAAASVETPTSRVREVNALPLELTPHKKASH